MLKHTDHSPKKSDWLETPNHLLLFSRDQLVAVFRKSIEDVVVTPDEHDDSYLEDFVAEVETRLGRRPYVSTGRISVRDTFTIEL